jgi:Tol biopolymer transport system component
MSQQCYQCHRQPHQPQNEMFPTWSSDGQKIAFINISPDSGVYVINIDSTNLVHLSVGTPDYDVGNYIEWSPDGQRIAFRGWSKPEEKVGVFEPDGGPYLSLTRMEQI